jgi:hypothetical protein
MEGCRVRGSRSPLLAAALVACSLLAVPASAEARESAATKLADRYSPVIAVEPQRIACGSGEAYRPTVVNLVLDKPAVTLRDSDGRIVRHAPTARDLARASKSDYLDLPGNPLAPGCGYEEQFKRWFDDRKPSAYVHIATDRHHPGKLAVEYWFYWTYNDFTDKHESDWEMAQVDFDAATPREALKTGPYEVDFAQHAGGERSAWNDPKLDKQGTHPVAYIAPGSHAAYFGRERYLGKGGSAIFGCEDTSDSTERIPLRTVLLPNAPVGAGSQFAWLDFGGRWGQKEDGINNGPTGPVDHPSWAHPLTWSEDLRTSSLAVPEVGVEGLSVTGFFCGAVTFGAETINWGALHPLPFVAILGLVLLAALTQTTRTTWRPPDPKPLRSRRAGGQILRASRRVFWADLSTFIGIGAIFLPLAVVASTLQWVLFHLTGIEGFVSLDGGHGPATVILALLIGTLAAVIAAAAVTAAVAAALAELDAGRRVTAMAACRLAWNDRRALAGATGLQFVISVLLVLTVVGIPYAIYRLIRTSLFAQACVLESDTARDSLRTSADLTRGQWWRTAGLTALIDALAILSGPIFGVAILLLTSQSLTFINIVGALVYAVTVPCAAIALTLYYFDLEARRAGERPASSQKVRADSPAGARPSP